MIGAKVFAGAAILLAMAQPGDEPAARGGEAAGTLVVLNKGEASASLLDRASGEEYARIATGEGPHEVAVSPDGSIAVVADYGTRTPGNTLTIIDLERREVVSTVNLGDNTRPHGIAFVDLDRVVVTTEGSRRLILVDARQGERLDMIGTRADISHMVALSPDREIAYVANIGSGSVSVLDLRNKWFVAEVTTGEGAEGIAVHPSNGEVWVANRAEDTIAIIDPRTLEVLEVVPCASFPIRLAFTPDGEHVLASCARSGDVAVFDSESRREVRRIAMELEAADTEGTLFGDAFGASPVPIGILIPHDGRHAYIANAAADAVAVVDLRQWKVVDRFTAGREPDGMAWSPVERPAAQQDADEER